jgi:hypothetical protein
MPVRRLTFAASLIRSGPTAKNIEKIEAFCRAIPQPVLKAG